MEGTAKKRSVNRAGKSSSEPFLDHGELAREFRLADAQIAAGHYFRHEDMKAWLLSWGKKNELPPPKCACGREHDFASMRLPKKR